MDLAVDVVSAMDEVHLNNPEVGKRALIMSGIRVGRAGIGTQTSTLLLAYLSSYLVPFMVYMAQSTPIMKYTSQQGDSFSHCRDRGRLHRPCGRATLSALAAGILIVRKDSSVPR